MMDEKKLMKEIKDAINDGRFDGYKPAAVLFGVCDMIWEMPKADKWIPFTFGEDGVLDCPLPDVDEEVLVSDGVYVWIDTLLSDSGGYYLDNNGDFTGLAWMPLPEPWKRGSETWEQNQAGL